MKKSTYIINTAIKTHNSFCNFFFNKSVQNIQNFINFNKNQHSPEQHKMLPSKFWGGCFLCSVLLVSVWFRKVPRKSPLDLVL